MNEKTLLAIFALLISLSFVGCNKNDEYESTTNVPFAEGIAIAEIYDSYKIIN